MDYKGIGLLLWQLGSYCFDVVTDVLNGASFLNEKRNTTVNGIFNSTNGDPFFLNETKFYNLSEEIQEVEISKADTIWGVLTLALAFTPGLIFGVSLSMGAITNLRRTKCRKNIGSWIMWLSFFFFFFPVIVPTFIITNIVMKMLKKDWDEEEDGRLYVPTALWLEASLEAMPQLVLQLHTILNGYDPTWIQCLSIGSSFTTIAISSITSDMEFSKSGEEDRTLMETVRMCVERMPCYLTTIMFRIISLTLTISFFREYSPIPIMALFLELAVVATIRMTKPKLGLEYNLPAICFLAVTNVGTMNAYTCVQALFRGPQWTTGHWKRTQERDQDIASFIKSCAIVTTIHHFVVMIVIVTMVSTKSSPMRHWESPEFLLRPSEHDFYWAISITMILGIHSLILILYRVRNIVAIK